MQSSLQTPFYTLRVGAGVENLTLLHHLFNAPDYERYFEHTTTLSDQLSSFMKKTFLPVQLNDFSIKKYSCDCTAYTCGGRTIPPLKDGA